MKTKTTESTTFDNILGFLWCVFIMSGCTYLVFWRGESAWWYVLAISLLSVSIYHKKVEIEN